MVTIVTVPNTTLSTTISPLLSGVTYYYQITAFNGTTPGTPSAVQSKATMPTTSYSMVLIGGKVYIDNGMAAVAVTPAPNFILNNTGGVITLTNGQTLIS
jgi:hypothetical protein